MKNKQNIIGKTLQGKGKERGYNYHEIQLIPSLWKISKFSSLNISNIQHISINYPSFIKDSPSIMVPNFLLAPSSLRRATTATGSVALRSPPSNNDVCQLQL